MAEATASVPGTKSVKAKNLMYTQDHLHAPYKDMTDLESRIKKLDPTKYAIVTHDRDIDDKGQPVRPHEHAMLSFKNARSLKSIAKALGEKDSQFVQAWRGGARNGFAYLCHRTKNSRNRAQYDPADVVANFDYPRELEKLEAGAAAARAGAKSSILLDALYDGDLTLEELESQVSGSQLARMNRDIQTVMTKRLEREAKAWTETMRQENRRSQSMWLFGKTETGKTSFGKELAMKRSGRRDYFVTGSKRDPFQRYEGQHHIIVDEIAPGTIDFPDLKKLTDPLGVQDGVQAGARYRDKALMPELIVFTSPYDPYSLYAEQMSDDAKGIDEFEQLLRRISVVMELTQDQIRPVLWNSKMKRFDAAPGQARRNPYSKQARGAVAVIDPLQTFDSICDELDLKT